MESFIKFLGRILLFCTTFFLLLEYVVSSDVPTPVGLATTIIACILTSILYYFTVGKKNRQRCSCCNQIINN